MCLIWISNTNTCKFLGLNCITKVTFSQEADGIFSPRLQKQFSHELDTRFNLDYCGFKRFWVQKINK